MLRPRFRPVLFSRQAQPAYICLPSVNWRSQCYASSNPGAPETILGHYFDRARSRPAIVSTREIGCQDWTCTNTARLNRPPCYFDTTWQWRAGRSSTCMVPFRRRMPMCSATTALNWSARQELHLRSPGSRPGMLLLHHALLADPKRFAPSTLPQTTHACDGAPCSLSYESEMVGSAGNAPVRQFQFCFVTSDLQSDNWIASQEESDWPAIRSFEPDG